MVVLRRLVVAVTLFATGLPAAAVGGQVVEPRTGLLVIAHGADSGWNARVRQVVDQVAWRGPVALGFLMGSGAATASWQAGVSSLAAADVDRIVVVPLMVSSFGAHVRQIRHYAGEPVAMPAALSGHDHGQRRPAAVPMVVSGALDDAPELGRILFDRWTALGEADRRRPVVLIAHGPDADADAMRWLGALSTAVAPLTAAVGTDRMRIGLLRDDASAEVRGAAVAAIRDTITALARRDGDSVVVMTVLVSSGSIDRVKVPADLAGMPMRYTGTVLAPHPALARWIERVAAGVTFSASRPAVPSRPAPR